MKRRNTIQTAMAVMGLSALFASPAVAQEDPTELGGGKKPYIVLVIDSSASMEYTDDGDNRYAIRDCGADNLCPGELGYPGAPDVGEGDGTADVALVGMLAGADAAPDWFPGDGMELSDATDVSIGLEAFGPCMLWEPTYAAGGACADYKRPAWKMQAPGTFTIATPPAGWQSDSFDITGVFADMMRSPNYKARLADMSQPRHVTVKEILTGDMILLPDVAVSMAATSYNRADFGPGCWFVPRQRDASVQPGSDPNYCSGEVAFEGLPDHDQPLPHFQEVWDVQWNNGVLDTLGTTAIFAVAAFDSYKDDLVGWNGFNSELNDMMDGPFPPDESGIRDAKINEDSDDCDGDGTPGDRCYNLGVWQVVGPKRLDIPATLLPEIAAYAQIAINDTGYLTTEDTDDYTLRVKDSESVANSFLGATFSKSFQKYADDVKLGKQPIAKATPLAAAMHDVFQFMQSGQDGVDPINDDLFAECRPKHVVLLTDGQPEPEYGDSVTLSTAFGYDSKKYPYDTTENEIKSMVLDLYDTVPPSGSDQEKYGVRVHVVGLNLDTDDASARLKMTGMAIEGQSCAQYMLPPERIPAGYNHADGAAGTCVTKAVDPINGGGCLVPQTAEVNSYTLGSGYNWIHPNTGISYNCDDFPALILDDNSAPELSASLSSYLSSLIDSSGLASRTRLVVASRLDDKTIPSGGQYRVYAGVRIGGNAWWKGVINRTTLKCDTTAPVDDEVAFDEQVAAQVAIDPGGNKYDSRRVWTTVPDPMVWCFTCGGTPVPVRDYDTNSTFPFNYALSKGSRDEFFGSYLPSSPTLAKLEGTRVPFEHDEIEAAFNPEVPYTDYNVADQTEMQDVINVFRGRIPERLSVTYGGTVPLDSAGKEQSRVIGGILNSNPVVVGPPNLDIPIGSYRSFRARHADRATMLYVSSMDGLLHALHMGRLLDRVTVRGPTAENSVPAAPVKGDAAEQREAWAYMPWMIHKDLVGKTVSQAYFMDGSPIVKDVRLCNQKSAFNQNEQACNAVCDDGAGCAQFPAAEQWRTVLVQSRGQAGSGYYAMDVTRPGGLTVDYASGTLSVLNPDPILLWEFDREWERAQLEYFIDDSTTGNAPARVAGSVAPDNSHFNTTECGNNVNNLWKSPLMGLSVSEPEIATILMTDDSGNRQQRPVVVFGGGANTVDNTECGGSASGMAIYVVDLQTGNMIRRFTDYTDSSGTPESFLNSSAPSRFVGSPALYDASPGAIATRGFIGDDTGRLFKIDFLDPDPVNWEVSMFFDPNTDDPDLITLYNAGFSGNSYGPAGFKPAIALNPDRDVMVVYGLGEVGDVVSNSQVQAVLALTEDRSNPGTGALSWAELFPEGEKVTGAPIIFDADVYFPTYALPLDASGDVDVCAPGYARVWGLKLADLLPDLETVGAFAGNPALAGPPLGISVDIDNKWFGPTDPTLIRGITVTLGAQCSVQNVDSDNPTFTTGDQPKPQLVAQTSGQVNNDLRNLDEVGNAAANALDRVVLDIDPPASQTIPLSWTLVF